MGAEIIFDRGRNAVPGIGISEDNFMPDNGRVQN
jgi:hypothetical protein